MNNENISLYLLERIEIGFFGVRNSGKKTLIECYKKRSPKIKESRHELLDGFLYKLANGKQVKIYCGHSDDKEFNAIVTSELLKNTFKNIIFVVDLTNSKSLEKVDEWLKIIDMNKDKSKNIVIFGNKFDLFPEYKKNLSDLKSYAETNKIQLFCTTAITGYNLDEGLSYIINLALQKEEKDIEKKGDNKEGKKNENGKKKGCQCC